MSPILTRPVREQFEHDRIIRLLQARYRRKFEVAINPGAEQNASVTVGEQTVFPDLVLYSQERGRRLQGTVEVETGESVNTLEAMSQWALFSRLRVPFSLYLPPTSVDTARRLCAELSISVAEIWTYHTALDQVRFTMVQRSAMPATPRPKTTPALDEKPAVKASPVKQVKAVTKPVAKAAPKPTPKPAPKLAPKLAPKPAPKAATKAAAKSAAKGGAKSVAKKTAKPALKAVAARKIARPTKRRR